ncbi:phage minor head protein [Pseudomonas segetis]|uniref:Phage Mu protein F like protein n=1 Tax=Pseudomonas segetis TaxID=298908 RepID=A0A239JPZ1_9PSED|nr:phage minor head protein [Pseudomonas segetis]SNT07498.1 Phage Mu protein F like protein [Pseudomonas segetis]
MADNGQPTLRPVLGQPFAEQVAFFRNKLGNLVPTARWDDIKRDAHDTGFMVAGAAKADLLTDLAVAVDRAVSEGRGLGDFRKDFRSIVERNGWHGWTGEGTRAGERWRTRTIYQTNAMTSYSAGRLAQLHDGGFDFWVYKHNDSVRNPRPEHQKLDGLTLPAKHPFWKRYYPPNGWGCQCYVIGARSAAGARRLGGDPDKQILDGWDADDAPGIDEGWDYQPGARVAQTVTHMAEKSRAWPYEIAKAYMTGVPELLRDQLAKSYRALPSVADDSRRYAQRVLRGDNPDQLPAYRTMGLLTAGDVGQVHQIKDIAVDGYDYALDVSAVRHVQRKHGGKSEHSRGQRPVTAEDYAILPKLLNDAGPLIDAGLSESTNSPLVRREMTVDNETYVAVFEVRRKRKMLVLQTFYVRVRK